MNRRMMLTLLPGALTAAAAMHGLMVPALGADAKSGNGVIEVSDAWARTTPARETTAYLEIVNHGTVTDHLVSVSSPFAAKCILLKTQWRGLAVNTVPVDSIVIPPMARTRLEPGKIYIQLIGVSLDGRENLPLSLTFAETGVIEVTANVTARMLGPAH